MLRREGLETRVTLNDEKPGHITSDTPWENRQGLEFIMTKAQAMDIVQRAKGKTPADWVSWTHLGTALHVCGKTLEGLECARTALSIHRSALTLMNVAVILETLGRYDEAMALAEEGNRVDPSQQFVGLLYAQALLRQGRWEEGWPRFEWYSWGNVWQGELTEYLPQWENQPLSGKKILVIQGGGFGDNLMFFRWFKNLREAGAHITYACPEEMVPLLTGHPWVDELIPVHEKPGDLPEFDFFPKRYDYFVPIMGLARRFGATVENTIATSDTYIHANPEKAEARRFVLRAPQRPYKKIGICWMGAEKLDPRRHRSLTTAQVSRLLEITSVDWISLQYEMSPPVGGEHVLNPQFKNWADTAAIIECCDLVVTVDTGVMHLAGAMQKPCFVILPGLSDWKFLLNREDSVFYPSLRLFRNNGEGLENALDKTIQAVKEYAGS